MSDIDWEHIDAVAHALHDAEHRSPTGECSCDAKGIGGPWSEDATAILESVDPGVHRAMLDALTRHGVLTEEHGYIPVDETGATWKMRSLKEALEVAENCPVGDTYGDGAPRPGIATIEHGMRYQSAWKIVGEVAP